MSTALRGGELIYDCVAVSYNTYNCAFNFLCNSGVSNSQYAALCLTSENLFGCVGLRKEEYCILNKKYSQEEYHALVAKVKEHMTETLYVDSSDRRYPYGEYFPLEFSPHSYNESVAFDIFPIQKESALTQGYRWKENEARDYHITVQAEDLPDLIAADVPDTITKDVVQCVHKAQCSQQCTTAFRISSEDLTFYRSFNLPLPRLCPNCRHYERQERREPVELWHRQCMCEKTEHDHAGRCHIELETSYAPERPEKVYCEACYQKEIL